MQFVCHTGNYATTGSLLVRTTDKWEDQILNMDCQANRISDDNHPRNKARNMYHYNSINDHTGFYACQVRQEIRLFNDNEKVETTKNIFKLIEQTIEKYNLTHVSDCQLTQVMTALEKLGVKFNSIFTINGFRTYEWNKANPEKEDIKEELRA